MYLKIIKDGMTFLGVPFYKNVNEYSLTEIFSNKTIKIDLGNAIDFSEQSIDFNDNGIFERVYNFLKNDNSFFDIKEKIQIVTESDDIYENFLKKVNLKVLSSTSIFSRDDLIKKIDYSIEKKYKEYVEKIKIDISSDNEMLSVVGELVDDLKEDINHFKNEKYGQINFDNFYNYWPTLLNPSPYIKI